MDPKKYKEPWPRFTGPIPLMLALGALSFLVYAKIWNMGYSLLIVVSLFVHEMGHVWAIWHYRRKVKGMYAIPLLGAVVISRDRMPNRIANIVVFLMGPAWGYAFAALTYIAYLVTGMPVLAGMAGWMAILNLFNLYPASMLDGGQAWKIIVSPLPRPLRIALIAAPVAAIGYLAFLAGSWLVWLLFAGILLASVYEVSLTHLRRRDRERVIAALAKLFLLEEVKPHVVQAHIDALLIEIYEHASRHELHPMFGDARFDAIMRKHIKDEDIPTLVQEQAFRICLTKVAQQARAAIRIRKKPINVTADGDLDAATPGPLAMSDLGFYIKGDPLLLPISGIKAVTAFVVYCLLSFSVLCFVWQVRQAPDAFDALLELMTR